VNIALTPLGPGPWDPRARAKLTAAQRDQYCRLASAEFRQKVRTALLPRLSAFRPELLFISAGFDAHYDDMYHFLTENDIHWVTEQLCKIIDGCNGYGVISVLEGGYSLASAVKKPRSTRTAANTADGSGNSTSNEGSSAAVLGKGCRQRSKRNADVKSPGEDCASKAEEASPLADLTAGESSTKHATIEPKPLPDHLEHRAYAQEPGDGGLVKG